MGDITGLPSTSALPLFLNSEHVGDKTDVGEDGDKCSSKNEVSPVGMDSIANSAIYLPHSLVQKRELVSYEDLSSESPEEENESSSDASSFSSAEGLMKTALVPVDKEVEGYDCKSPPENGSQFLLHVQNQRKNIPKIATASKASRQQLAIVKNPEEEGKDFQKIRMPKNVPTPTKFQEFLPTQNYVAICIHQFSNLYLKVIYWKEMMKEYGYGVSLPDGITLPSAYEKSGWFLFCFGTKLVTQLTKIPRARRSVTDSRNELITSFFSEDLDLAIPADPFSNKDKIVNKSNDLKTKFQDLTLSETKDVGNEVSSLQEPKVQSIAEDDNKALVQDIIMNPVLVDDDKEGKSSDSSLTTPTPPELEEEVIQDPNFPLLSIILNMSSTTVDDVLHMHINWLKHYGWFHDWQGKWIYALLACLERPLSCDVVSDLRELSRMCAKTRKAVCEHHIETKGNDSSISIDNEKTLDCEDDTTGINGTTSNEGEEIESTTIDTNTTNTSEFQEYINMLNLFICLVGNYFQQHDLEDKPREN